MLSYKYSRERVLIKWEMLRFSRVFYTTDKYLRYLKLYESSWQAQSFVAVSAITLVAKHGRSYALVAAFWIGLTFGLHAVAAHALAAKIGPFELSVLPERDTSCFDKLSYLQRCSALVLWIIMTHVFIITSTDFFQRRKDQGKFEEIALGSWSNNDCARSEKLSLGPCRVSQVDFSPRNFESLPTAYVTIDFNGKTERPHYLINDDAVTMISTGPRPLLSSTCFARARISKIRNGPDEFTLRQTLSFDFQQPDCTESPEDLRMQIWQYKNGSQDHTRPPITFRLAP